MLRSIRSLAVIPVAVAATLGISLGALFVVFVLRRPAVATFPLARRWGRFILRFTGVTVKKKGGGKLDPERSYVFAANHQSQFDILLLNGYLGHPFSWLAKKELFRVPVWGRAMRAAGYIPVDRSRGREAMKSLAEAAERIASGTSVVIFPEGTRSPDGRLASFKSGGMQLAIRSGVPVVPVAISGTYDVLPKGRLLASPGAVTLSVGEPLEVSGYRGKRKQELADLVHSSVAAMLREEGGELLDVEPHVKND